LIEKNENSGCIFFSSKNRFKIKYVAMAYSGSKINFSAARIIISRKVTKKFFKTATLLRYRIQGRELDALSCFLYNPQNLNEQLGLFITI
jgi:hypothetical protein